MGADKATIEIDGIFMAQRVADALRAAGATTVVAIGGDVAALGASGLEVHPDRSPGAGPLGAVAHALDLPGAAPVVAVLACDLLAPDPALVVQLVARRATTDADVVVPVAGGRPQWVHAVWHRRVAGVLADVFACGERSLVGASAGLRVEHLEVPDDRATRDADRPEDLPRSPGTGPRVPCVDIPAIDIGTLSDELASGAPVVDVRQPDEYDEAHVPGARLIPLAEVPDRVGEFPTDREVYIICKSGGRSAKAVEFLRAQGVEAVNVTGGTMAWIEAGEPVERGA